MTKEELFPKEKYPLRARLTLDLGHVKIVKEVYYQVPPGEEVDVPEQAIGVYASMVSQDDALRISSTFIMVDGGNKDMTVYKKEENGQFIESDDDEMQEHMEEFEDRLEEASGIDVEENNALLDEKIQTAKWESF